MLTSDDSPLNSPFDRASSKPGSTATDATLAIAVSDPSQVGEARRAAAALATQLHFDERRAGELAIIVTELASNLARHAGGAGGVILLRPIAPRGGSGGGLGDTPAQGSGIEVLSLDQGGGIANVNAALADGFTTGRTPGTGLGAVQRLSTSFDLFSTPGRGVGLVARVWPGSPPPSSEVEIGATSVPMKGQTVCGDAWCVEERAGRVVAMLADGLGHGPAAAEASQLTVGLLRANADRTPQQIVEQLHAGLRPTRGAAVAVAAIDPKRGTVAFCGIGNIAATVVARDGKGRSLLSHNGTLGAEARRIAQREETWPAGGLLLMFSDGIASRWQITDYPGLLIRHVAVIAGVIYRDHCRGRDDATVLAVRLPSGTSPSGGSA